ncbi:MAG TPA: hypothetical protein VK196_22710, partial [Magnetospirillum sp.]|nr:hypothetical protein [Magnetospirillum sp.]
AVVAELQALRRAFPDLSLGVSHEAAGAWDGPVYYTCARFFVMNRLLERYGCPIMTCDADVLPTLPVERIFAVAAGADFACFQTGRDEPASFYQASIMVFGNGARAAALAADLARFCALKLGLPQALSWMLDQAAVYSLLAQRQADDPGFRFCPLDTALATDLDHVLRQLSTPEEKLSIMSGHPAGI